MNNDIHMNCKWYEQFDENYKDQDGIVGSEMWREKKLLVELFPDMTKPNFFFGKNITAEMIIVRISYNWKSSTKSNLHTTNNTN